MKWFLYEILKYNTATNLSVKFQENLCTNVNLNLIEFNDNFLVPERLCEREL